MRTQTEVQLAKGYRFKTILWIHPSRGGDDYQLVAYSKDKPDDAEVKRLAKRKGSRVLNDFHVEEIKA